MEAVTSLAKEFVNFEKHHSIPPDQRELARSVFYFGAACVVDVIEAIHRNAKTSDDARAIFDGVRREVHDFGMRLLVGKLMDSVMVHIMSVDETSSGTH